MKLKWIKFFGIFLLFLLTGCGMETVNSGNASSEVFSVTTKNCWPCDMYMQAFRAIDSVLNSTLENVARNSLIVLQIGFLFWLLMKATTLLMSFSKPDMKKEIASFATISFKFVIVVIFLHTPAYIYDFFGSIVLQPMGEGFLSLSETVLQTPEEINLFNLLPSDLSNFLGNLAEAWNNLFGNTSTQTATTSRMFGGLAVQIHQIIFRIFAQLWHGVGLGFQLLMLEDFSAFIAALFVIFGLFSLLVRIPLYFIDSFLRIGLIMLLMPLLMVGWVFSYPKGLIKTVFSTLFSSFFDILFNCIYITFIVTLLRVYQGLRFAFMFSDSYHTTESGLRTMASKFTTNFLIIIVLIWSMVKLADHVKSFSGFFFSGAGKYGSFLGTVNNFKTILFKAARIAVTGVAAFSDAVKTGIAKPKQKEGSSEEGSA